MADNLEEQQQKALEMVKQVCDDKEAEINGRKYKIHKLTHKKRLKVFAFYTSIKKDIMNKSYSFLGTDEWLTIENIICGAITYNDTVLTKIDNHWEKYPQDYLIFISTMLTVFSYPFLSVNA